MGSRFDLSPWNVTVRAVQGTSGAATADPYGFSNVFGGPISVACTVGALTNSSSSPTELTCKLPGSASYQPTSSEVLEVIVDVSASVATFPCDGLMNGVLTATIRVNADVTSAQSGAAAAVDVVGVTAGTTGSIVSIIGSASMLDLHALAMLLSSPCASLLDQKRVNYMMYVVSPFYSLGNVAVVFGNMGIAALVAVLQMLIAWFFRNSRNIPTLAACAAVYFPSIAMKITELLYVGVVVSAFGLLRGHERASDLVVGLIGAIYTVGVPVGVVLTIHDKINARMVQYTQFLSRPFLQRLLLPWGFWTPEVISRAYGRHIGGFLPGFRMYLSAYPMVVVAAAAIFTHLLPTSTDCFLRFLLTAVVFFVACVTLLGIRPHRIHATTAFGSATFLVLGVLSVVLALAFRSPSESLELLKLVLCAIAIVLTLMRVVFDGVVMYLDHKYWRHFREQNRSAMHDDGVVGSANERMSYDIVMDEGDLHSGLASEPGTMPHSKKNKGGKSKGAITVASPLHELVADDNDDNFTKIRDDSSSFSEDGLVDADRTPSPLSTSSTSSTFSESGGNNNHDTSQSGTSTSGGYAPPTPNCAPLIPRAHSEVSSPQSSTSSHSSTSFSDADL